MNITELWCYPIKSCGGFSLQQTTVDEYGVWLDRHWMLMNSEGVFLSQRATTDCPGSTQMARIRTRAGERPGTVEVAIPGHEPFLLDYNAPMGGEQELFNVRIHSETARVVGEAAEYGRSFSEFLELNCRLVCKPNGFERQIDPEFTVLRENAGLADGYPFLLASEASLQELNRQKALRDTKTPEILMRNFRPNIVISGCEPFAEDAWKRIRIGSMEFRVVKPCARCPIVGIDQLTGERLRGSGLATLKQFRKLADGRMLFGQNLIHDTKQGELRVGEAVEVLEYKGQEELPKFV